MPAQPGETTLTTLFADIHYFFAPPTQIPQHHRFDKGSYVYVHQNSAQGTGRIEIANHAGTPEQDAFAGSLDCAHVQYSYKQTVLYSITLDKNHHESSRWQLPSFDPQNQRKYMYPLQSLDIYFWTPEDAKDFTEALTRIQRIGSLRIESKPQPASAALPGNMSTVVQKLEQAAISSPYHDPRRESTSTSHSFPPPPPMPGQQNTASQQQQQYHSAAASAPPSAYNPAAPAKPEPHAQRIKTPPPPDPNTGLQAAASYEGPVHHPDMPYHNEQFQNFNHHTYHPQAPTFAGPPGQGQQQPQVSSQISPPPPSSSAQSFPPPPPSGPISPHSQQPQTQAFSPVQTPLQPGHNPQQVHRPSQQSFSPPPGTSSSGYMGGPFQQQTSTPPSQQQQTQSFAPPPAQDSHPSPPPGGFSSYNYSNSGSSYSQPQNTGGQTYDIHNQAYRPTEHESKHGHGHGSSSSSQAPGKGKSGRIGRVESGVNRFLKKLDGGI